MRIIATLLALLSLPYAYGIDITVGAGQSLFEALSTADSSETTLIVRGTIDANELPTIRDRLPDLTYIDMSNADIIPPVIPDYTFAATKIEQFQPPHNLAGISEGAFAATPLKSFSISGTLTDIGPHAFAHCHTLTQVSLGDNIAQIKQYAFSDCPSLTSVSIGSDLLSIGECAFQLSGLESLDLTHCDHLVSIGDRAFAQSPRLKHVSLPDHKLTIGSGAFSFSPYLVTINGLEGTETLPELFAADCLRYFPDLTHAEQLTDIQPYAFHGVKSPTTIFLPATLDHLGTHSMASMHGLKYIYAMSLNHVPDVDTDVWADIDQSKITLLVAEGMENEFLTAPQWCDFKISSSTAGIDDFVTDDTELLITTVGTTVTASTSGACITSICLYLTDGRLAIANNGNNVACVSLQADNLAGLPVIITATDSRGRRSTIITILVKH